MQRPITRKRKAAAEEQDDERRVPFLRRIVDAWWDRVYLLVFGRVPVGDHAQLYEAGRTSKDYLWNTLGQSLWGALFPLLTIISTQLTGAEEAGRFNLAFTIATLLLFLGNYGVRTFQVSDIGEMESFSAYKVQRILTCLAMIAVGWAYCTVRAYDTNMTLIMAGAFGYRAIDAFADVYEGRLQQVDKLYLSGISIALRALLPLLGFSALLLVTRSLAVASVALALVEAATVCLITIPLTLLETPVSRTWRAVEVREIFRECFPAFTAIFLFNLIETVPKFLMEGALPYEDQVYFSALYFPAQMTLMAVGFIYKPQLVRLATIWQDPTKRRRFDLIVLLVLGACVLVSLGMLAFAATLGIPLASLLYATDFEKFRVAQYLMLVAGGFAAAIDFLFQILTVLREQASATRLYVAAFIFVSAVSTTLIHTIGFMGAVYAYLAVMVVLFTLLFVRYLLVRLQAK